MDWTCSVGDPGCLFRILIFFHPGSRISDQKRRRKYYGCCLTFYCDKWQRVLSIFNPKCFYLALRTLWVFIRDPRSGIWKHFFRFRIQDKKAPDLPDLQNCLYLLLMSRLQGLNCCLFQALSHPLNSNGSSHLRRFGQAVQGCLWQGKRVFCSFISL